MTKLKLLQLYPLSMNIYGDRGNVIAIAQRARWRGIEVEVDSYNLHDRSATTPDFHDVDLFFFGGGQDKEQVDVSEDLQKGVGGAIKERIEEGAALLSICGGYQLLGHYFKTGASDQTLQGISLFDAFTVAGQKRFIGDVIVEASAESLDPGLLSERAKADLAAGGLTLVGFENHSGKTYLQGGARPLGVSKVGFGNNGEDGFEGAVYKNAIGCYLHGSLLPKNPWLTDYLLLAAYRHHFGPDATLPTLDDSAEMEAHQAVFRRIKQRGRVNSAILK